MKALILKSYTGLAGLEWGEVSHPKVGPGEVLIQMAAAPINPSDLIFIKGHNPGNRPLPVIPGFEGSGTVVEVGSGSVAKKLLGKRVACRAKPGKGGTWAEYLVTDAERCVPLIAKMSLLEGSTLLVNPLTAYALVDLAQKQGYRCAIQTAAASNVGKMMIRFAKKRKLKLINIVRGEKNAEILRSEGSRWVLNSESPQFISELQTLAKKLGATVAFDAVAGDFSGTILKAMPQGSELWCYGGLSEKPCSVDPMVLIYQEKLIKGMWLPPLMFRQRPRVFQSVILEIQKQFSTVFKSTVKETISPQNFRSALADYETSMSSGKCIIRWGSE